MPATTYTETELRNAVRAVEQFKDFEHRYEVANSKPFQISRGKELLRAFEHVERTSRLMKMQLLQDKEPISVRSAKALIAAHKANNGKDTVKVVPLENERTYETKYGLKTALESAGLGGLNYEVRVVDDNKFAATVFTHNTEDCRYVKSKGFTAVISPAKAAV